MIAANSLKKRTQIQLCKYNKKIHKLMIFLSYVDIIIYP